MGLLYYRLAAPDRPENILFDPLVQIFAHPRKRPLKEELSTFLRLIHTPDVEKVQKTRPNALFKHSKRRA